MGCFKCGNVSEQQNLCENCASLNEENQSGSRKKTLKRQSPSLTENEEKETERDSEEDTEAKRPRRSTRVSALKAKSLINGKESEKVKAKGVKKVELKKGKNANNSNNSDNTSSNDKNNNATGSKPLLDNSLSNSNTDTTLNTHPSTSSTPAMTDSTTLSSEPSVPATRINHVSEPVSRPAATSPPSQPRSTTASSIPRTTSTPAGTLPSRPTATNPTASNANAGARPPQVRFAFGFSLAPLSQAVPADIQWVFNESGPTESMNMNIDDMMRMMHDATQAGGEGELFVVNGVPSTRIFTTTTPISVSRSRPRPTPTTANPPTTTNPSARTRPAPNVNANTNTPSNNNPLTTNPLDLARQMFEIVSASRTADSPASLAAMLGQMTQFMFPGTSPLPSSDAPQIENMLNELFTRAFAAAEAAAAPPGLSDEAISKLPTISESDIKSDESVDCAICRDNVKPSAEDKCVKLPCNHMFHFECIQPWLKRVPSCPICRRALQ